MLAADRVITALSTFAKMPGPTLRPLMVRELVQTSVEAYAIPENVVFAFGCPEVTPSVLADGDQLRIALVNLIRNACEAMPGGGRLTLDARLVDNGVELDVSDTGIGIPPHRLQKIMEPLYSTKTHGLGLGLAIVRSILDKNRGSLRVRSEVGQGSTFTICLNGDRASHDAA